MKKYEHLKTKAIELRKQGHTLNEIIEFLSLPKGTIYYWIKDVEPDIEELKRRKRRNVFLTNKRAGKKHSLSAAKVRDSWYNEGITMYEELSKDTTFKDFIMLYLTEGYRKNRNSVSVANSNPTLVKLGFYWITKLSSNKIDLRIQYHKDNDPQELIDYWQNTLNTNKQITLQRKSNSGDLSVRKWRSVYGVLTVRVGDTKLRMMIQAWMDILEKEIEKSCSENQNAL